MAACCRRITIAGAGESSASGVQVSTREFQGSGDFLVMPRVDRQRRGIVLRSWNKSRRLWVIEAVPMGSDGRDEEKKVGPVCSYAVEDQKVEKEELEVKKDESRDRTVEVVVAAAVTVVMGVGNRVLYKLALVPLKHYPFFLAQLATFGYVLVYFSILYLRYHGGLVTDEMLSLPKTPYLAVGFLEALGAVSGMAAGAILSGAAIPILSQSFLVWQLILSYIFLGRRYKFNQLLGCFLVAVGVVVTVASGSSAGSLIEAGIFWSLLMIVSFLFQAADTILKGALIYS